jgi:hypothetical protein
MEHPATLNKILQEVDLTDYPGDISNKYLDFLRSLVNKENFFTVFEDTFNLANKENNLRRLNFLTLLLIQFGGVSANYESTYLTMMDIFINKVNYSEKNEIASESYLELVLDLFWHQDSPLKHLDSNGQLKLYQFLTCVTKYKYQTTDFGDERFFAIAKSMDLIKYQKEFGDSPALIEFFLNHFDPEVSKRAREYQVKNLL